MNWRTKIELALEKMGVVVTQNPIKIIFIILFFSLAMISNISKITIDTSTEGFLHANDPSLVRYEAFKEQFGQDEKIMVIVKTSDGFEEESSDEELEFLSDAFFS